MTDNEGSSPKRAPSLGLGLGNRVAKLFLPTGAAGRVRRKAAVVAHCCYSRYRILPACRRNVMTGHTAPMLVLFYTYMICRGTATQGSGSIPKMTSNRSEIGRRVRQLGRPKARPFRRQHPHPIECTSISAW
jgi:hypothetical protein